MSERHPGGFLIHPRRPIAYRPPAQRIQDFSQIHATQWSEHDLQTQGERCMDCGVGTCMNACPIANLIPEWGDLVHRGRWREALDRLHATNNFPEFTGYTCPAPCEDACVLSINASPVTIKSLERAIVDRGWEQGWISPQPPAHRNRHGVAIVGSGPAGLAAAQQLNRAGHRVTVFERDDVAGGLMTYGIPDFKFAKHQVIRRVRQLTDEGVLFRCGVCVGAAFPLSRLRDEFDAVLLALGAQAPRPLDIPGGDLAGVEYAMDYLVAANRQQAGRPVARPIDAGGLRVVVLGGGDTGADCVATALRQHAAQVVQADIHTKKPRARASDNPWPEPSRTWSPTYAQEEGSVGEYGLLTRELQDDGKSGRVSAVLARRVEWRYDRWRRRLGVARELEEVSIDADLVLVAIGFAGPDPHAFEDEPITVAGDGSIDTDASMMTSQPGIFAAGDANMGQSIVVWAIGEGRDAAHYIDRYLTGGSYLPLSVRTENPPARWRD